MRTARRCRLRVRKSTKPWRAFSTHSRAANCWMFPPGKERFRRASPKRDSKCRPAICIPKFSGCPDIDVRRGDLSGALPYADAEFQYITCLEGLEHIENPHQAIREFARLLAPGGQLVISVPNILNIEERVKWLLNGYTSHFKPISQEHLRMRHEQWGEKEEVVLHINPIAYTELRYILEKYGFEVLGTYRDKPKPNIWLYWPLVAMIRFFSRLTPERKRRERWTEELASDAVLLGGNTFVLHA